MNTTQINNLVTTSITNARKALAKEFIKINNLQSEFQDDLMSCPLLYCVTYYEHDFTEFLSKTKYRL